MKQEFVKYLNGIGIVELFFERAESVLEFYEDLYPNEIESIFVSEYIDDEGKRQYENLWLFTSWLAMESKLFLTKDEFDATPIRENVKYWKLRKTEFDLKNSTEKSRMEIEFGLVHQTHGSLKASKENCGHLYSVFKRHILSNMEK